MQCDLGFLGHSTCPLLSDLTANIPECSDPASGTIAADVNGGTGNVSIEWDGIDPNAVAAGTYSVVATDEAGCIASSVVTVEPADIPEPLELEGDVEVVQGDSAAYYYEYTLGSTYEWSYSGALEEQALASSPSPFFGTPRDTFVCKKPTKRVVSAIPSASTSPFSTMYGGG